MEKSEKMVVVKTSLGEDHRRFAMPRAQKLLSFVALIHKLYGYDAVKNDLVIQYKDEEGDLLNVTSDEELHEALRVAESSASSVLRVVLILVPAGARQRTVVFEGRPITPSDAALQVAASSSLPDLRFDAPKKPAASSVEIKIELEPTSKEVTHVRIESTKSLALPVAPRPDSVAALSAATAIVVKQFSDAVLASMDVAHNRGRDASSHASAQTALAMQVDSDAARDSVERQHERTRTIAVPAEFVAKVSDLAAQTVALTNSYSTMTQQLLDPLSQQTIAAANEATRDMAAKLNEDVAAIVKMLMDTSV